MSGQYDEYMDGRCPGCEGKPCKEPDICEQKVEDYKRKCEEGF